MVSVSPSLLSVYLAVLLDKMGAMMVLPLLPFIARSMNGSSLAVGLLQSLYSLMQVFGTLALGMLADTWGKRRILLLSLFSSSVFLLACGLAVSLPQLLLFRAGHGFFAGTVSICQAIVADVTPPEDRVGKMALIMAAYGVGVVLGPGLAGLIAPWGVFPVCAVASACTFSNFCIGMVQIPEIAREASIQEPLSQEATHGKKPVGALQGWSQLLRALLSDLVLLAVCSLSFLQELGMGIFMGVSALFFKDRFDIDASELGLLFCVAGAGMVVFQGFVVGKFVKIVGRPMSIFLGWILRLAVFLSLASLHFSLLPWLAVVCIVAGGALIDPCAASFTSDKAPEGMSGIFLGTYQAAASMGSFLGPVLGGLLYEYTQTAPYCMASVAALLCVPSVLALFRLQEALEKELAPKSEKAGPSHVTKGERSKDITPAPGPTKAPKRKKTTAAVPSPSAAPKRSKDITPAPGPTKAPKRKKATAAVPSPSAAPKRSEETAAPGPTKAPKRKLTNACAKQSQGSQTPSPFGSVLA
eukprot:s797_g25.t2